MAPELCVVLGPELEPRTTYIRLCCFQFGDSTEKGWPALTDRTFTKFLFGLLVYVCLHGECAHRPWWAHMCMCALLT